MAQRRHFPTYHDLRHCYASWLVQRGRTLKEVQELFGHRTVNMTNRYAHLSTANRRQAVAVLDDVLPAPTADPSAHGSAHEPIALVGVPPKSS
jgi:integrase